MDVSKIISDAGAFSILNRAKNTDDTGPKVQNKQAPEAELVAGEGSSSADLMVQIIQDASELSSSKDTLDKDVDGKGRFIDKKV